MPETAALERLREELAEQLFRDQDTQHPFHPIDCNRHIASSGLQKAIRRGDTKLALRCAARLLGDDPRRLWRRLLCIVFEDVGVGDIELVGQTTAVTNQKRWRDAHGGEWCIASHLIERMCATEKDRTSDELVQLAQFDPELSDHRRCWRSVPIDRLQEFVADPSLTLPERALAIWFAIGTNRYAGGELPERKGFPDSVRDTYLRMGLPDTIVAVCRSAQCSSIDPLSALLPLVWQQMQHVLRHLESDSFPDTRLFGDLPAYAIDGHTRTGKKAVSVYLQSSPEMQALLESVPKRQWSKATECLLFHVEGGLCERRLRWPLGDELRRQSQDCVPGLSSELAERARDQLRSDIPHLNEIRADLVNSVLTGNGLYDEAGGAGT